MEHKYILNLEEQHFNGEVLDIGKSNSGIVYNIYKNEKGNSSIEYLESKVSKINRLSLYDSCVLMFSLHEFCLFEKKHLITSIHSILKDNGVLYIWDLDKPRGIFCIKDINIILPGRKQKSVKLKLLNIFDNNTFTSIIKLLQSDYDIIECRDDNGLFYIKAKKRKCTIDEGKKEAALSSS